MCSTESVPSVRPRAVSGAHHGRVVAQPRHELEVLVAGGDALQLVRVHLRQQLRFAGAHGAGDGVLSVGVEREALAQNAQRLGDGGIDCGDRGAANRAVLVEQVDHAQLGHIGHGEAGHSLEGLRRVQAGGEQLARACEEGGMATLLLTLVRHPARGELSAPRRRARRPGGARGRRRGRWRGRRRSRSP